MAAYLDGNAPFGSQVVAISTVNYVAEKISYNEPATVVERRDEAGAPAAQVVVNGFGAGTAELQFATTATVIPSVGSTFTLTRQGATTGVAPTMGAVITGVSETYGQLEIKKCSINFRRRYN